ncbi:MAG: phosphohydrolase [Bacteroidetes bacterium]|jgi:predicted metal-dependent HD superfamily phosphohydrolase|nr:phosphohydrolase [Bacteroidota bacterium]
MDYKALLEQVAQYVTSMFGGHADNGLPYHNKAHTQFVVDSTIQIANHYQLSDSDFFVVVTAAWFHDTGYLKTRDNHERESVKVADNYLRQQGVDQETIARINQCIMATEMPQNPQNLLEEIICDADMFHMGTDNFSDKNKLLRKEIETASKKEMSKEQWRLETVEFMEQHHYFTDYCNVLLNDRKKQNLDKLKERLNKEDLKKMETDLPKVVHEEHAEHNGHIKKNKDIPERGIETMFRITSGNNQRLSDMADGKAHILITVNSIILSAIISLVLRKLDTNSFIIIPTFMLLAVSVLSIIFSILSTRPSIPRGVFSIEEIDDKKVNLLFFGNFYKMKLDDYYTGMQKVMSDKDLLYHTLIMDVYSQGVVLGRKYHQLRVAYNIFMFGLIISVLAFVIAVMFHTEPIPVIPK